MIRAPACADYLPALSGGTQKGFGLWAHYVQLKGSSDAWASRYVVRHSPVVLPLSVGPLGGLQDM